MNFSGPRFVPTHPNIVELDRIGDEIAELSAHLDAATDAERSRSDASRTQRRRRHSIDAQTSKPGCSENAWTLATPSPYCIRRLLASD